jgi:hypothetical protein
LLHGNGGYLPPPRTGPSQQWPTQSGLFYIFISLRAGDRYRRTLQSCVGSPISLSVPLAVALRVCMHMVVRRR